MPNVAEWHRALSAPYSLRIESTQSLCSEVSARQQTRSLERRGSGRQPVNAKPATAWPPSGQNVLSDIRPIDMLHALGRITTPLITELIDLSSTWAEIRYIWAFRPNLLTLRRSHIRLNDAVKQLDFHQKTLLSDELGVGFAAYYMARFEQATDPVDVFIAHRNGQVRMRADARRSLPDYIFRGPLPDHYFVVECKGTQGRRAGAIRQLQRGMEQVVAVGIDGPAVTTHLVIGSAMNCPISLLIVDPDGAEPISTWSHEELQSFSLAKKLTYVGRNDDARQTISDFVKAPSPITFGDRLESFRKTGNGTFEGSEEVRLTPDGRELRLFRGFRSDLLTMSLKAAYPEDGYPVEMVRGSLTPETPFLLEEGIDGATAIVRSLSPDGSMFEIEVR
jgi:hypothetical protein